MNIKIDTHTHTISSGHAFSTISENISHAKKIGILALGITEHSIKMPGSPVWMYFTAQNILPKEIQGIRVYRGIELNIDKDGNVDDTIDGFCFTSKLDYAIASLHSPTCPPDISKEVNTKRVIMAMEQKKVKIIGHLGDPMFPCHLDEVLKKAAQLNIAIELNNSSLNSNHIRFNPEVSLELCKKASQYGNYITFGSDAHYHEDVGNFTNIFKLIEEGKVEFDESKILSSSIEIFEKFIYA